MNKPLVFIARPIPENGLRAISEVAEIRLHDHSMPPTREKLLRSVAGCSGILSLLSERINAEVFDAAGPQLRVVSNFAVGFNNIDVVEAHRRGIAVGNTPDVLTDATADIAVALMLAAARRLKESWQSVVDGRWKTWEPLGWIGQDVRGKTLGVIGMGRIGQAVARRLVRGWDMRLLYTSRHPKPHADTELNGRHASLEHVLRESDFISIHVALSADTKHLIDQEALDMIKPGAVLVNTARGEVVDQDALLRALQGPKLFAAGLDVCDPEPLPSDHPLLAQPNCIVLPHIGSATQIARNAMAERAALNLIAGLQQQPLPFPVQPPG